MSTMAVRLRNADQMMTRAEAKADGIHLVFADGRTGVVPFADIDELKEQNKLVGLDLPNPYTLVLHLSGGESTEIPWDFARDYCDPSYRPRMEAIAAEGRRVMGHRIRSLRADAGLTQEELSGRAGIGRVTLVRLEHGEQSPRYETLMALASALNVPVQRLLVDETGDSDVQG